MLELKPERLDAGEFNEQVVSVCGKEFIADWSGALYWPAEEALIVADLHLEKGSSYAARGAFLPPYDTRETLARLAQAIDRFSPATIISLGDGLHEPAGAERMCAEDRDTLAMLQDEREWIWITGNHDPVVADGLGGHVRSELEVAGLVLRHAPGAARLTHEIAGHLHPAAKVNLYGHTFRRPCFAGNGLRLVLPAFGAFTGGLNVLDEAFVPLFGDGGVSVWLLGQEGLYPIASRLLRED